MLLTVLLVAALAARSPAAEPPKPAVSPAPQAPPAAGSERTAEQEFKNIKVLTGMPASQMMPVMHLMRASLGVQCGFCHVTEGNRFDLDTKMEKETAREMIRMVFSINKDNFEGQTRVTCNTCHRGQEHPVRVPPIGQGQFADTTRAAAEAEEGHAKLPTAAEVLDRYIQALGGRAALEAVQSRVSRGTLLRMRVDDSGTPKARAVNRGQEEPFEIAQQATDLRKDLELRGRADKARVTGREPLDGADGKEAFVLRMPGDNGTSQTLYFDAETGLLRRQIINRPTVLGPDPEQTDFDDYRAVGNVKVPFVVKTSYLDDNHLGTTRKLVEVKDKQAGGGKP
jgi:hypothetical protein